eukprot:3472611-Prymnesium_polylepis.1
MGARLDPMGVLMAEAAEPVKPSTWVGKAMCTKEVVLDGGEEEEAVKATLYQRVKLGSETIGVGDCVFLTPECRGEPCEVGRVVSLFEYADGQKMLSVQWFWRPEHIEMPASMTYEAKEVFLSDTSDYNPIEAVERKCVIVQTREDTPPPECTSAVTQAAVFWTRSRLTAVPVSLRGQMCGSSRTTSSTSGCTTRSRRRSRS